MSKRTDGAQEGSTKTTREIISLLQGVDSRPFDARELGHLDILISRVLEEDADREKEREMVLWAFRQNYHLDHSNAAVHTAPVRYSPLTFRLAECLAEKLEELEAAGSSDWGKLNNVLRDLGTYAEDPGR